MIMKKLFLLLTFMIGAFVAHAENEAESYTYLTFETTEGAKISVSVASLNISISGSTLTAGDQSFTLSNLSKMYFSTTDETSESTDIKSISLQDLDEVAEIYDLNGRKMSKGLLHKGVYVVKSKSGTYKIAVK